MKFKIMNLAVLALLSLLAAASLPAIGVVAAQETGICGRTAQVRGAILPKLDGITDCADVTTEHLAGITGTIDIIDQGPMTLQNGDFTGLSGLENVYLNLNNLSTLPADVFDGLTSLKELYPYNNNLTALPEGVFDDLGRLEKLNLSRKDSNRPMLALTVAHGCHCSTRGSIHRHLHEQGVPQYHEYLE